ncbi:glycosyltransferase [Sphingobacterium sp. CZ-UAM]|uniref:glycosyltransferase family 4 protein n=1 Tax=Sphingobacterium sp. CZ-UAM TaxID=1933868 RepID=UPI0009858E22|nr:glycosyltransferase family 1 protein [Sphingobacterium sp. CZ-UAM]OOG19698.1 glycosyltransferase [Sphingobacterium sp. CZ-UAM]
MKTIVISAVNLNKGGTLTILRNCLAYLSVLAQQHGYRVVAIVYKRELADFPNIEYFETQWAKKRWINRLWFEYVSLKKISRTIENIDLWLSLHDTTPNVVAKRQAVYCHNPFPFYKWSWQECCRAPRIVLFALFSKWIYRIGIYKNSYVIVQQQWLKDEFKRMFGLAKSKIILALPNKLDPVTCNTVIPTAVDRPYTFIYAAAPDSHKNFEVICRAAALLEKKYGKPNFRVYLTVLGNENAYASWLFKQWGSLQSLAFIGFQSRQLLYAYYAQSDCLIFPSKVETWGLPITEFASFDKPMLLANSLYAYETAAGADKTAFFDPAKPEQLALQMEQLIAGDDGFLLTIPAREFEEPMTHDWKELFEKLLNDAKN